MFEFMAYAKSFITKMRQRPSPKFVIIIVGNLFHLCTFHAIKTLKYFFLGRR